MACTWTSPVTIPGIVAMAMQTLLQKVDSFELTQDNLESVEALNRKFALIKDADTSEIADLAPLIGFRWQWA